MLYPGMEIASIAVAVWAALFDTGAMFWISCALGWTLLCLAAIDIRSEILPDIVTLPLIMAGITFAWTMVPEKLPSHVAGAVAGFATLFLVELLYRKVRGFSGLGMGDAKLAGAAGSWLGWQALAGIVLIASVAALFVALANIMRGRAVSAHSRISFGPYLCLAFWVSWMHGPLLISGP